MRKVVNLWVVLFVAFVPSGLAQCDMKIIRKQNLVQENTMSIKNNYSIFEKSNGLFLKSAFIVAPGVVELKVESGKKFKQGELVLYEYDYERKDKNGQFLLRKLQKPFFQQKENGVIHLEIKDFDDAKNYVIRYGSEQINVYLCPSIGGILDTYFDASNEKGFGVRLTESGADFKLWSPPAARVEVVLYDENQQILDVKSPLLMKKGIKGVWQLSVRSSDLKQPRSLDGLYYHYRVFAYGKENLALDPYAFSMAAFSPYGNDLIGKGAIVDMNSSKAKVEAAKGQFRNSDIMSNENDLIAYEVHVRDFTIQPGIVDVSNAGTFVGFSEKIHHLIDLGVTHVQFLPIMNGFSVNENDRTYKGRDSRESNYNWGYDAHHYFALEGWLSTNPNDPYQRIREFRNLVFELHKNKIGVILDVVYNHVFSVATFENIAPACYFRLTDDLTISKHTGAGPSLESRRKMVRYLMIESLKFFVSEYNIDGFRFDLMGFHDHETMRTIRREVGGLYNPLDVNELILHGEAWVFSDLDTSNVSEGVYAATTKINYPKENLNLGFFNDVARDAISGRNEHRGFVQGLTEEKGRVASAVVGGVKGFKTANPEIANSQFGHEYNLFAEHPNNCLNFLSIHDGLTLWDKINLSWSDASGQTRLRLMKQAKVLLFTSQGKVVLHGGDEILRTKPLANFDKEKSRAVSTFFVNEEEGVLHFHENSYSSPDFTNMFRWDRLHNQYAPLARSMKDYTKGLIQIRRAIPAFRMIEAENVRQGVVFLGDPILEVDAPAIFKSFDDEKLERLILRFVNGPKSGVYYLAGEVHRVQLGSNPVENPFEIVFSEKGEAEIVFSKTQILAFDLGKWGDKNTFNIKLVKYPGAWETIDSAYSHNGNNAIRAKYLDENGVFVIDLSKMDFPLTLTQGINPNILGYFIDNTLEISEESSQYGIKEVLVIHNVSSDNQVVKVSKIQNLEKWSVICDAHSAGMKKLKYEEGRLGNGFTDVEIGKGFVKVPGHSSVVIVGF